MFVVLYDVNAEDEQRLDRWEGSELGIHRKIRLRVDRSDGGTELAWLYVLDAYEGGLPSARYIGVMADAAEKAGAPEIRARSAHPQQPQRGAGALREPIRRQREQQL